MLVHVQYLTWVAVAIVCCASYSIFIPQTSMSSSPLWSPQSKTHPPSNNTPLSIRGTETHAQSSLWGHLNQYGLQSNTRSCCWSCRLPFLFYPGKVLDLSQAAPAETAWYIDAAEVEAERLKTKGLLSRVTLIWLDKSHNPRTWPGFVRWTWLTGEWRRKNQYVILISFLLFTAGVGKRIWWSVM